MNAQAQILAGSTLAAASVLGLGINSMIQPASSFYGKVYWSAPVSASAGRIAITFDDGPSDPSTSSILDTLGEMNVKATFFVIGQNVRSAPKLIQRMDAEGHVIANHSFDHPWLGMLRGPWYWKDQIARTDHLIEEILGKKPAMFRPPMGVKTWFVHRPSHQSGHCMITWSRRARDGVPTTPAEILKRLVPHTVAGDILMLHDGIEPHHPRDPAASVAVVRPLIAQLTEANLHPVRLDELLGLDAYQKRGE